MVIVLDEGPDPSVTKEIVCRNCGARLEYIPQGIKHNTYREIDGGSDTCYWIVCPMCSKNVTVKGY